MRGLLIITCLLLLSGCTTFRPAALDYAQVAPKSKSSPLEYAVYTPPNWHPSERLPLIVFLHGGGGSHFSFEYYGAHEYLDTEISAGRVARAIIVLPNGDNGFWENWADGTRHYRDWVLDDVMPAVQSQYNTLLCPQHCHLVGISMGGFGVLRFAYFAHDRFSSVSAISAPILNEAQSRKENQSWLVRLLFPFERIFGEVYTDEFRRSNPFNAWVDDADMQKLRLQLVWGDQDSERIRESNKAFHARLVQAGVEHDKVVYLGGHKWKYWIPTLDRVLNFSLASPP